MNDEELAANVRVEHAARALRARFLQSIQWDRVDSGLQLQAVQALLRIGVLRSGDRGLEQAESPR